MIPPTPIQARLLAAIRDLSVGDVPPSYQELADEVGKSRAQIHYLLNRMQDRGLVTFEYGRARSIRIIEPLESVNLTAMSGDQLVALRSRIEAELIGRWVL